MRVQLLLLGLVAATACASYQPRSVEGESIDDEHTAARAKDQRADQLEQTLSELSAGATPPACGRVCELVGQICDLSRHICLISSRHRDDPELASRCASGERRCRRSQERIPPGCSCPDR